VAMRGVDMLCDSLMNNNGILRGNDVITFIPERSAQFKHVSTAFFAEIERKFLEMCAHQPFKHIQSVQHSIRRRQMRERTRLK
jgi:hypothetical protein